MCLSRKKRKLEAGPSHLHNFLVLNLRVWLGLLVWPDVLRTLLCCKSNSTTLTQQNPGQVIFVDYTAQQQLKEAGNTWQVIFECIRWSEQAAALNMSSAQWTNWIELLFTAQRQDNTVKCHLSDGENVRYEIKCILCSLHLYIMSFGMLFAEYKRLWLVRCSGSDSADLIFCHFLEN